MATTEKVQPKHERTPPYIPWKTLDNYIGSLKGRSIPHTLDGSIKPRGMAGGMWRQLLSALRFLGLTKNGNEVVQGLESLVNAHGTEQWGPVVKETVLPAFDEIVGTLPLEKATPAQLQKCFADKCGVSGQVLAKCVRFYLQSLKSSGTKFSSHLSTREPGSAPKKSSAVKRKPRPDKGASQQATSDSEGRKQPESTPQGMVDFPIPIGNSPSLIRIPRNITMEQFPMVEAMLNAVKTLAEQNAPK